jgi:hypothetical protein
VLPKVQLLSGKRFQFVNSIGSAAIAASEQTGAEHFTTRQRGHRLEAQEHRRQATETAAELRLQIDGLQVHDQVSVTSGAFQRGHPPPTEHTRTLMWTTKSVISRVVVESPFPFSFLSETRRHILQHRAGSPRECQFPDGELNGTDQLDAICGMARSGDVVLSIGLLADGFYVKRSDNSDVEGTQQNEDGFKRTRPLCERSKSRICFCQSESVGNHEICACQYCIPMRGVGHLFPMNMAPFKGQQQLKFMTPLGTKREATGLCRPVRPMAKSGSPSRHRRTPLAHQP